MHIITDSPNVLPSYGFTCMVSHNDHVCNYYASYKVPLGIFTCMAWPSDQKYETLILFTINNTYQQTHITDLMFF